MSDEAQGQGALAGDAVNERSTELRDLFVKTFYAHSDAEDEVYDFVAELFGQDCPCEDVWIDAVDWEGHSLELKGAEPNLEVTPEIVEKAYQAGFDVIDIETKGLEGYKRYYPEATKKRHEEIKIAREGRTP